MMTLAIACLACAATVLEMVHRAQPLDWHD